MNDIITVRIQDTEALPQQVGSYWADLSRVIREHLMKHTTVELTFTDKKTAERARNGIKHFFIRYWGLDAVVITSVKGIGVHKLYVKRGVRWNEVKTREPVPKHPVIQSLWRENATRKRV